MPVSFFWRVARKNWLFAPLTFGFLCFRKLLRLRFPANHASCNSNTLPLVEGSELPERALEEMQPLIEIAKQHGFQNVFYLLSPCIGNKQAATAVLLNSGGDSYVTVCWFRLQLGVLAKAKALLSCHSVLRDGTTWNTASMSATDWHPEFAPPQEEMLRLPASATESEVLLTHLERVARNRGEVLELNRHTLEQQMLTSTQRIFDHMIQKGYFVPLTPREVRRLLKPSIPNQNL